MTTFDEHADQAIRVTRTDPIAHLDWQITCMSDGCDQPAIWVIQGVHRHPSASRCGAAWYCAGCGCRVEATVTTLEAAHGPWHCTDHDVPVRTEWQSLGGPR